MVKQYVFYIKINVDNFAEKQSLLNRAGQFLINAGMQNFSFSEVYNYYSGGGSWGYAMTFVNVNNQFTLQQLNTLKSQIETALGINVPIVEQEVILYP